MKKITALRTGKGRQQVRVFLDGEFAFSLGAELAAEEMLRVDESLSAARVEDLIRASQLQLCFESASRYLSYRPRSEPEMRERLRNRGFDSYSVDTVIARLREQGLLDDMAFAHFWRDNRQSFSPRSRALTRLELRRKGVTDDVIERAVAAIDDEDSAYRAALKKARSLPRADYESFRRRLSDHLRRRGFAYGLITRTVNRMWQDQADHSTRLNPG